MLVTAPADAVKLVWVAPAGTVTDVSADRTVELFEEIPTEVPPVNAADVRVTVQLVVPPEATGFGEHDKLETAGLTVIVPPTPVIAVHVPSGRAPITLATGTATELLAVVAMFAVIVATIPLPIAVPFIPVTTQVRDVLVGLQFRVLPEAVSAGPAAAVSDAIFVATRDIDHCRLAGAPPDTGENERFSATEPPATVAPDARVSEF